MVDKEALVKLLTEWFIFFASHLVFCFCVKFYTIICFQDPFSAEHFDSFLNSENMLREDSCSVPSSEVENKADLKLNVKPATSSASTLLDFFKQLQVITNNTTRYTFKTFNHNFRVIPTR